MGNIKIDKPTVNTQKWLITLSCSTISETLCSKHFLGRVHEKKKLFSHESYFIQKVDSRMKNAYIARFYAISFDSRLSPMMKWRSNSTAPILIWSANPNSTDKLVERANQLESDSLQTEDSDRENWLEIIISLEPVTFQSIEIDTVFTAPTILLEPYHVPIKNPPIETSEVMQPDLQLSIAENE